MNIEKAISLLPVGYRHVLVLHDMNGYKPAEICELLQINAGTCSSHLFNGRKTLQFLMQGKLTAKVDQYLTYSVNEMKALKAAFTNVALPDDLGEQVARKLYSNGLFVVNYKPLAIRRVIAQSLIIILACFAS
jgi:hypothetical protein